MLSAVWGQSTMADPVFKDKLSTLKNSLKVLNTHLKGKYFLVGDSLTVADIVVASALT